MDVCVSYVNVEKSTEKKETHRKGRKKTRENRIYMTSKLERGGREAMRQQVGTKKSVTM